MKVFSARILCGVLAVALTSHVARASGVVTAATESNLRTALIGGGTVTFAVDGTILLSSTLVITNDTTLSGSGHAVVLDGGNAVRVLYVNPGVSLTLSNLTVVNGSGSGSGGAVANYGNLIAVNSTFAGNQGAGAYSKGGAIFNEGTLSVESCSFLTNSAYYGGAIGQNSALLNSLAIVRNSTFWSNSAPYGAAMINLRYESGTRIYQSTFFGQNGIALYGYDDGNLGSSVLVERSIVAYSTPFNCFEVFDTGGNLNSDGSMWLSLASFDYVNPMLGPLTNNGGPTLTMAPLHNSPAIDFSGSAGFDQRGVVRPIGFRGDCGAVELDFAPGDLHFGTSAFSVIENAGTALITLTRFGDVLPAGNVSFIVTNGSATSGTDFWATNGVLNFADGESNKTFAVQLLNDSVPEPAETVKLGLFNPTGGIVFGPGTQATLTIVDDDVPLVACDDATLRAAVAVGGLVTFGCDGTIFLTNTLVIARNVTLDGAGHDVTISGNNSFRVFEVGGRMTLTLKNLTIVNGHSVGADGAAGLNGSAGLGAAVLMNGTTLELVNCRFRTNITVGGAGGPGNPAGAGGGAFGGAICLKSGTLLATNTEFTGNAAIGGAGGTNITLSNLGLGGVAGGGAIYQEAGTANLTACSFIANQAQGGNGTVLLGAAYGGTLWTSKTCSMTNSTVAQNSAVGGQATGGGILNTNGTVSLCYSTVSGNTVLGSASYGGAMATTNGTTRLVNTIVADSVGGSNFYGIVVDLGHNISSDASGGFSAPGSLNNTDPKLGDLLNSGGPTQTLPLMPDSPAIDAAQLLPGVSADQRGIARPFLASSDIGAYEWNATSFYPNFRLHTPTVMNATVSFQVLGPPNQSFRVQATSDFTQWTDLQTNVTDVFGASEFGDSLQAFEPMRFYRTASP